MLYDFGIVISRSLHHQQEVPVSGPEQGPVSSSGDNGMNQYSHGVGPGNLLTSQAKPEGLDYSLPRSGEVYPPVVPRSHHLGGGYPFVLFLYYLVFYELKEPC